MNNPFHDVEQILEHDPHEAIRALLATIYLECCEDCGSRLRSEEFLNRLQHMRDEMTLCRNLTEHNVL